VGAGPAHRRSGQAVTHAERRNPSSPCCQPGNSSATTPTTAGGAASATASLGNGGTCLEGGPASSRTPTAPPLSEGSGQRPDIASIPGLTPAERTIGSALQAYGAYFIDIGGAAVAIIGETPYTAAGQAQYASLGANGKYAGLNHLPWDGLRVVVGWNGS